MTQVWINREDDMAEEIKEEIDTQEKSTSSNLMMLIAGVGLVGCIATAAYLISIQPAKVEAQARIPVELPLCVKHAIKYAEYERQSDYSQRADVKMDEYWLLGRNECGAKKFRELIKATRIATTTKQMKLIGG